MKSEFLIALSCILLAFNFSQAQLGHSPISKNTPQGVAWTENADCGVPFWIALNTIVRESPPSVRYVFVFIEPHYFTEANISRIFLCLSQKYSLPANLIVTARSDKALLYRWINYRSSFNPIRADGSFETKRRRLIELPKELENEIGSFRADYYRSEITEDFSFSPDPIKEDRTIVVLKRRAVYASTGDTASDLVRASLEERLTEEVKRLLNSGANVNARSRYGNTPLLAAILMGNSKIVNILLDRGANINQADPDGWTPLMYALAYQNDGIAEELLRRGADVNTRAVNGDTALTIAVSTSQGKTRMAEQLLRKGADVHVKDRFGRTPLMIAEENEHMDYIRELLKKAAINR